MAAHAHSTTAPNAQATNYVNIDPTSFRINGCTPLRTESAEYFSQAHALLLMVGTTFTDPDGGMLNNEITASAIDGIAQLVAHGIYLDEVEVLRRHVGGAA